MGKDGNFYFELLLLDIGFYIGWRKSTLSYRNALALATSLARKNSIIAFAKKAYKLALKGHSDISCIYYFKIARQELLIC